MLRDRIAQTDMLRRHILRRISCAFQCPPKLKQPESVRQGCPRQREGHSGCFARQNQSTLKIQILAKSVARRVYGRITTFTHESSLSRNISYPSGACSSRRRWLIISDG